MSEFLKTWHRKIGVVCLLLACVFMGEWVRSKDFHDSAGFTEDGLTDALVFYQGPIDGMRMISEGEPRNGEGDYS